MIVHLSVLSMMNSVFLGIMIGCVMYLQINQIGTVTEAIEVVKQAKDAHWGVVASHRSGETDDSFIADLAVGLATGQIKAGAPCRGEHVAKYNQVSVSFVTKKNRYLLLLFIFCKSIR